MEMQQKEICLVTWTMSLSASFPREEILMSSPSSSTIADGDTRTIMGWETFLMWINNS